MDREEAIGDLNLSIVELAHKAHQLPAENVERGLAKLLYDGYRIHTDGKSLATGQNIPEWDGLKPEIQEAWTASSKVATLFASICRL